VPFPVSSRSKVELAVPSSTASPSRGHLLARVQGQLAAHGATHLHRTHASLSFRVPWDLRWPFNPLVGATGGRISIEDSHERIEAWCELRFVRNAVASAAGAAFAGLLVGATNTALTGILVATALWLLGFGAVYVHATIAIPRLIHTSLLPLMEASGSTIRVPTATPHN